MAAGRIAATFVLLFSSFMSNGRNVAFIRGLAEYDTFMTAVKSLPDLKVVLDPKSIDVAPSFHFVALM